MEVSRFCEPGPFFHSVVVSAVFPAVRKRFEPHDSECSLDCSLLRTGTAGNPSNYLEHGLRAIQR